MRGDKGWENVMEVSELGSGCTAKDSMQESVRILCGMDEGHYG